MESATLIWLLVLVCLSAAACQTTAGNSTTQSPTAPPDTDRPIEEIVTGDTRWATFTRDGISLGLRVPKGWEADTNDAGIILAEHMGTMETGGVLDSVQVHCFVHLVEGEATADDHNQAWEILSKIVADPAYIDSNDSVSGPVGFTWDDYDAAYYLLNNGDGSLKILLALAVSDEQLVACSISAPWRMAARIRSLAPAVLGSLTVNGHRLDSSALHNLPDPLEFPNYHPEVTAEAP